MTRLFSSFDLINFSKTLFFFFPLLVIGYTFMAPRSMGSKSVSLSWLYLSDFFYSLKQLFFSKITSPLFFVVFWLIFSLNIFSLWPYVFSRTRQMRAILIFSLPLWVRPLIFQFKNNPKYFIAHLVPEGTPMALTWFLVVIELIRNLIRPITLTVRLLANILAGHLIMRLLSGMVLIFSSRFLAYFFLNTVESFVSLIQAYIFSTILCLYYSEMV